jgi:hypothetical protein
MPKRGLLIGALAVSTLLVVVGANGAGMINNPAVGYLLCINTKTKVVTHPGTETCPKGTKGLVVGSKGKDGAPGLTGATGLNGQNGLNGMDGKTLWNGTKDPENTWGSPGDMFINSVTKTLFGPKDLDETWPVGVSMVGPKGDQGLIGLTGAAGPSGGSGPAGPAGANGTNATIAITELFVCDGPDAGTVANEKCKIGMTGPGGGLIFFVDYNDIYAGFNYLEAAPEDAPEIMGWSNEWNLSVPGASGLASRAVGRGQANTTSIMSATPAPTSGAAKFADNYSSPSFNGVVKSDWFLGSIGEMRLMYDNLRFAEGFNQQDYWSSSEFDSDYAWFQIFANGAYTLILKADGLYVRPIRSF